MVTDAEKYEQVADHDAVSAETAGARMGDETREKLASAIEGSLAALGSDSVVSPSKQVETEPEETDEESEEVVEDEETTSVEDSDDESDEESGAESGDDEDPADDEEAVVDDKKKSAPTLPATYRRSLKAYGWEDDEIDAAMGDNAEQFTLTAMKIHRTRNDEISKFAEAGRRLRQGADQDQQSDPSKTATQATGLKAIDTEALIEKYGNEEIVLAMAAPINDAITQMQSWMPQVQAAITTSERTQRNTLGKAIDTFFGSKEMAPYEGLYGKPEEARTPEQTEKYQSVLEQADAIIAGAAQQGRMITFEDAMESAHADISKGFTEKAVRSKIKKTVKQRSKSLSLKPSHSGKSKKSGDKPSTRKQLETKTSAALSKVFT